MTPSEASPCGWSRLRPCASTRAPGRLCFKRSSSRTTSRGSSSRRNGPRSCLHLKCLDRFASAELRRAAEDLIQQWTGSGRRLRLGRNHVVLEARGPATSGIRTVVTVYPNGQVLVPFSSYGGQNSGIPIERLITDEFRAEADDLFGFSGAERQARTSAGWLTPARVPLLLTFALSVAAAYADATSAQDRDPTVESGDVPDGL